MNEEAHTAKVIDEIALERERQVASEGWTPEHDDDHDDCSLARAAACYAAPAPIYEKRMNQHSETTFFDPWPWIEHFRGNPIRSFTEWHKKGKDRRRQLVIAAALIVAEIERLDRAESAGGNDSE